jgi:hypothetical protein
MNELLCQSTIQWFGESCAQADRDCQQSHPTLAAARPNRRFALTSPSPEAGCRDKNPDEVHVGLRRAGIHRMLPGVHPPAYEKPGCNPRRYFESRARSRQCPAFFRISPRMCAVPRSAASSFPDRHRPKKEVFDRFVAENSSGQAVSNDSVGISFRPACKVSIERGIA